MKSLFTETMKKVAALRLLVVIAVAAVLALSCDQSTESVPDAAPAGVATGRVILSISPVADPANIMRSVLPTKAPEFTKYKVVFKDHSNGQPDEIVDPADITQDKDYTLAVGNWTVEITAYMGDGTTSSPYYEVAKGEVPIEVKDTADTVNVYVPIKPLAIGEGAESGKFTCEITFPNDVTDAKLTLKDSNGNAVQGLDELPLTTGMPISKNVLPGYYDLVILLTNASGMKAGLFEKAHIYSGLESALTKEFEAKDFASLVYMTGVIADTNGTPINNSGTLTAYADAEYKTQIHDVTEGAVTGGNWIIGIPANYTGTGKTVFLKATTDGATYFGKAVDVPEEGMSGIELKEPPIVTVAKTDGAGVNYFYSKSVNFNPNNLALSPSNGTVSFSMDKDGSIKITWLNAGNTILTVSTGESGWNGAKISITAGIDGTIAPNVNQYAERTALGKDTDKLFNDLGGENYATVTGTTITLKKNVTLANDIHVEKGITLITGAYTLALGSKNIYVDSNSTLVLGSNAAAPDKVTFTNITIFGGLNGGSNLNGSNKTATIMGMGSVFTGNVKATGSAQLVIGKGNNTVKLTNFTLTNSDASGDSGTLTVNGTINTSGNGTVKTAGTGYISLANTNPTDNNNNLVWALKNAGTNGIQKLTLEKPPKLSSGNHEIKAGLSLAVNANLTVDSGKTLQIADVDHISGTGKIIAVSGSITINGIPGYTTTKDGVAGNDIANSSHEIQANISKLTNDPNFKTDNLIGSKKVSCIGAVEIGDIDVMRDVTTGMSGGTAIKFSSGPNTKFRIEARSSTLIDIGYGLNHVNPGDFKLEIGNDSILRMADHGYHYNVSYNNVIIVATFSGAKLIGYSNGLVAPQALKDFNILVDTDR